MPGTGMKVPMRYTTSAPTRNSRRLRISPWRPASASAAAGLVRAELATSVLEPAAGGADRCARTLGGRDALEHHRLFEFTREHHLRLIREGRYDPGLLESGQI